MGSYKRVLTGILLLLLIFSGCAIMDVPQPIPTDPPQDTEVKEEISSTPVHGGTISLALSPPDSFNPLLVRSRDMINFLGMVFESPVAYGKDLKPEPMLAERWEVLEQGRLWIFHIRKDVRWHDGEIFTGEDVLYTFEALMSGRLDSYYQHPILDNPNILEYGLYNGNPYAFFLRLETPSAFVPDMMTFPVISSRQYRTVELMLDKRNDLTVPSIGTGPFRMDSQGLMEGVVQLSQNTFWWQEKTYIEHIQAKVYENNETARTAFFAGEVDVVDTTAVYAHAFGIPGQTNIIRIPTQQYEMLAFNNTLPLFQDRSLRLAIAYAIDRKEIISKIYLNNAETVDVPISPNAWLYDSSYRVYDYDPERASKILAEAGWVDTNDDGILDRGNEEEPRSLSFTLLVNEDNDLRRQSATLMAKHLELVGMKVKVQAVSWERLTEEYMATGEFDAILTGYYLDYAHDLSFAFHSSQIDVAGGNFIGYESESLDELLTNAAAAYSDDVRMEIYQDLQRYFVQQMPVISMYFRTGALLTQERIHGMDGPLDIRTYRNIQDWYIDGR